GVHAENPAAAPVAIPAGRPWPIRTPEVPSSIITRSERPLVLPVVPAVRFEDDFIPNSAVQRAFSSAPSDETAPAQVRNWPHLALRIAAVVVMQLSVVYVFSQPVRTEMLISPF